MALGPHFLMQRAFREHHLYHDGGEIISVDHLENIPETIYFKSDKRKICVSVSSSRRLNTNYYVGTDWLNDRQAIYIEPKLNNDGGQTDYLKMMFLALQHPDTSSFTGDLYEIKFDKKFIAMDQREDMLTPLLVIQYLKVLSDLVRKGLQKSYYKVTHNLNSKIKGKVLVSQTIQQNVFKNRALFTKCSFEEYGVNGPENRLLKKALMFVQRYLPAIKMKAAESFAQPLLSYILPAFNDVSDTTELSVLKHRRQNPFYKEYTEALRLAELILRRFGFDIDQVKTKGSILTPPFWIDMSKLFELYVLGLLKERFRNIAVLDYHFIDKGNELDYLLRSDDYALVVDAKYKPRYRNEQLDKEQHSDIRQVSGYARLSSVYEGLGQDKRYLTDCLIIYPDQKLNRLTLAGVQLKETPISQYEGVYKIAVSLPILPESEIFQ